MGHRIERGGRRDILPIAVFIGVSFALAWLLALPLWLGDGLRSSFAGLLVTSMMFAPTVAALIVVFFIERPKHKAQALGLVPLKPVGRLVGYLTIALVLPIMLCVLALVIGFLLRVRADRWLIWAR